MSVTVNKKFGRFVARIWKNPTLPKLLHTHYIVKMMHDDEHDEHRIMYWYKGRKIIFIKWLEKCKDLEWYSQRYGK